MFLNMCIAWLFTDLSFSKGQKQSQFKGELNNKFLAKNNCAVPYLNITKEIWLHLLVTLVN